MESKMALSDTAEYWNDVKRRSVYTGKDFVHIPNSTCGHLKPETGNTNTSKYLKEINCYACLKLIKENGNIYNLKEQPPVSQNKANTADSDNFLTDIQIQMIKGKICPYCKRETEYVDSYVIYGTSYGMIYLCRPCDAYCGVHKGTNKALGRLANAELRMWKKFAHAKFDLLWKLKYLKRKAAYRELSEYLNIPFKYTHIGMFSVATCKKVFEWSDKKLTELKNFYNTHR